MKNLRINKCLVASMLSFTMFTVSLVGCVDEEYEDFTYEVLEDGTIECSGKMDYALLKGYEVVELTIFDKKEIYIAQNYEFHGRFSYSNYYANIINEQRIYSSNDDNENKKIQSLGKVEDYLLYYDAVKESYSIEDIQHLLAKIKEDRELKEDKSLSKNK